MEGKGRFVMGQGGEFTLAEGNIPDVPASKVLVRNAYSTINPSDNFTRIQPKDGFLLGKEGCGTIMKVGAGVPEDLVGKKVAFMNMAGGAWGTHSIQDPHACIVLHDTQDLKQAACTCVNPLTVAGLIQYCLKAQAKSIIMTAASSALGKQFVKLAKQHNIEVINLVRKDEQVAELKEEAKAEYVFNQNSPSFIDDVKAAIAKLETKHIIECVGGDFSMKILGLMPRYSTMIILGNLTHAPLQLNSVDMIYNSKKAEGFFLGDWALTEDIEVLKKWRQVVADDLNKGGPIFGTKICKEVPLEGWKQAYEEASAVATQGKLLINCE